MDEGWGGDVVTVGLVELIGEGLPGARPVAEIVAGGLGSAGRELALTEIAPAGACCCRTTRCRSA